jgi:hypothetical protein
MRRASLWAASAALASIAWSFGMPRAEAARTLDDYRHFRALSIDLVGRVPTRAEVAAFEADGFDVDAWAASQLKGAGYVDRLRRIYLDLLRLQVGSTVQFVPQTTTLRRTTIKGPNGKDLFIYYRRGQRRTRDATDGDFCLTGQETGYELPKTGNAVPWPDANGPHPVLQADLDANTVAVKPWWLYRDYKKASPTQLYDASWATTVPGFVPVATLLTDADGTTPTTSIRICKEEAQTADMGTLYAPGHVKAPPPAGRLSALPTDTGYAKAHKGEAVSCSIDLGGSTSADCGCGVGLERCLPGDSTAFDPKAFAFTSQQPLGLDLPTDQNDETGSAWNRVWWGEEASRFLGYVFEQDRDFREVLTAKYSLVNGPLAQFYRSTAPSTCCGNGVNFGNTQPDPLFDPAALPADLLPHDATQWELVADRGPHASGLLTMPVFLTKFGSRRARAHVLYNAFKCQDFIAGNIQLKPSTEPNLMIRDGCSTCHATLEPLASYFSRVQENDWTFLPPASFPVDNPLCKGGTDGGAPKSYCASYYDPAFTDDMNGTLRGAYPDTYANGKYGPAVTHHADDGPAGLAAELTSDPEFPRCVAQNVASAMLGRRLTADDAGFQESLAQAFVQGGYKMSELVKALVASSRYRASNNWTSTQWRKEQSQ